MCLINNYIVNTNININIYREYKLDFLQKTDMIKKEIFSE